MALSGAVGVTVVYRADAAAGPQYWANRWEVEQDLNGLLSDPEAVAAAFRDAFLPLLLGAFYMDHVLLSTYAPDSEPYNPDNLFVLPVNTRGTRPTGGGTFNALPLFNVLHVRKLVSSGRLGRCFLRGTLAEEDIVSDQLSGSVSLVNSSGVFPGVVDAFETVTAALPATARLALISGSGAVLDSREVTGLQVAGVTYKGLRTKRKSRIVENAVGDLQGILGGGVTLEEIPALLEALGPIVGAIGAELPPLLP